MYLNLDTRYNPFTFDEMVKPLLYYKQAYDETEAAYSDLSSRAEQLRAIAESEDNPIAKATYQNYSNDLKSVVDDFSKGMTPNNRSALLDMKRRYAKEISPIETAFKRKAELVDEQRKILTSDPTRLFQRNASDISIDDFVKNPTLDYGSSYSGAQLTQQVAQAASNIAKEARDSAEGKRLLRSILPYQYEYIRQNGFSRESVIQAIMDSPDADQILTNLVDNVMIGSGILNWKNESATNRAYEYARQGLWNAIGDTKSQIVTDAYNMNVRLADRKAASSKSNGKSSTTNDGLPYRPVYSTKVSTDKDTVQMGDDSKFLSELIDNPELLSKEETRKVKYYDTVHPDAGVSAYINIEGTGSERTETHYPNLERLESLIEKYKDMGYMMPDGDLSIDKLMGLREAINGGIRSSAIRSSSYNMTTLKDDTIQRTLLEDVSTHYTNSGSTGVRVLKDGKIKKEVDIKDIDKYISDKSNITYSPEYGFITQSIDDSGRARAAVIDIELLDDPSRELWHMQTAINELLDSGAYEEAGYLINGFYDGDGAFHKGIIEKAHERFKAFKRQ